MEEERGLALFLGAGIFLGVLPPVASRSWHRCIADSAVLLVGHFECLLCNSPAFDLAYLSTSEVVPPSLVLHYRPLPIELAPRGALKKWSGSPSLPIETPKVGICLDLPDRKRRPHGGPSGA